MKKLFVVCLFILLSSNYLLSQNYAIDKGAMIIGGAAGFSSTGTESGGTRSTLVTIVPSFDYFIIQNLFIGGAINFQYQSNSQGDGTTIGIGPEIGYAFGNPASTNFPFLRLGYSYTSISDNLSGTEISIGGGIIFEIIKHFGLVGSLSYNIINTKISSGGYTLTTSGNAIILSFGFYGLIYK